LTNKYSDSKFIILQVILSFLIATIPIYFYIVASVENQNIKDKAKLKNFAASIIVKMEMFASEDSSVFEYPRSNIYTSGIFDKNDKPIFSLLSSHVNFNDEYLINKDKICTKMYIAENIIGAKYVVVCKKTNYSQVIYNVIILIISVISLIFLSSFITIKQSIEPYKKLNTYLDNFIKDAMHELKTPLGVARLNIDMLATKVEKEKYILRIKSALKNMSVIYEDLEYYMRQNIIKNEIIKINFSEFLENRVEFFKDLASAKDIKFFNSIQPDIFIEFDTNELNRIIDNNLSNAIKYSKHSCSIFVKMFQDAHYITLEFKDEGVGIKDTSKIFERYYRGDKISGGFGIGLSIVKKICDKNNIVIEVDSKLQKGTTFSYKFLKE
jgi:K+-sensing histidine kinase KdpD